MKIIYFYSIPLKCISDIEGIATENNSSFTHIIF